MKKRRAYQDWRPKHLRCCVACGSVWRPRRRKTCPRGCPPGLQICLTCDRAWPEEELAEFLDRRCDPPAEPIRNFVRVNCRGNWDHARRRLKAAHGDIARAIVALKRTPQRAQVSQPARPDDPAAVRDYRARQRGG